ncbi:MAG: roadblock/LC7 domain-containing protein [Anaerolineales bacterium]|nr:roadblock/LC7 domain-containing protein [Anaerolineales bacterium]
MAKTPLHDLPLFFDKEQMQQIDRHLLRLADRTGAPLVMLADISGRLILYRGRLSSVKSTGLAALAAGGFAAALEIGSFLGLHNNFQHQLLEGPLANLYIVQVGPELLLLTAYTHNTTFGMVRLFVKETHKRIWVIAQAAAKIREEEAAKAAELEDGFGDELNQQLDELFADE